MTRGFATIKPECQEQFDTLKETKTLDYIVFVPDWHKKEISVAKSGKSDNHDEIVSFLTTDAPRYMVTKFTYDGPTGDEKRHKLVFITWVPEGANSHDKTYCLHNKDHLYRSLDDLSLHVQASKPEDLAHATILKQFKVL
ncbi:hypothetical protein N7539_006791 [Penicillium diatomitis]|uniref:Cofilin n=1 Tax=Penicillium diatomitis TaxID=2819901 RepID=A0A9W9X2J9_9EURO|nr:uncharacterized protein N7539_006791 [Penicillium diatomitis]KAJ5480897.1 hypothetical protein N7539_006791 [Penicillium diatomitis]